MGGTIESSYLAEGSWEGAFDDSLWNDALRPWSREECVPCIRCKSVFTGKETSDLSNDSNHNP